MGQLVTRQALVDTPATRVERLQPERGAAPAPTVVMVQLPAALAEPKNWAAGLIAAVVVIVGLFSLFGGGSADEVIAAKDQTIAVLQETNERMAQVAEAAVSVDRGSLYHSVLDAAFAIVGAAFLLLMGILFVLLKLGDARP